MHQACFSLCCGTPGTFVKPDTFVARPNERVNLQVLLETCVSVTRCSHMGVYLKLVSG